MEALFNCLQTWLGGNFISVCNSYLTLDSMTLYELALNFSVSSPYSNAFSLPSQCHSSTCILGALRGMFLDNGLSDLSQKMGGLFYPTAHKAQSYHSLKQRKQAYL